MEEPPSVNGFHDNNKRMDEPACPSLRAPPADDNSVNDDDNDPFAACEPAPIPAATAFTQDTNNSHVAPDNGESETTTTTNGEWETASPLIQNDPENHASDEPEEDELFQTAHEEDESSSSNIALACSNNTDSNSNTTTNDHPFVKKLPTTQGIASGGTTTTSIKQHDTDQAVPKKIEEPDPLLAAVVPAAAAAVDSDNQQEEERNQSFETPPRNNANDKQHVVEPTKNGAVQAAQELAVAKENASCILEVPREESTNNTSSGGGTDETHPAQHGSNIPNNNNDDSLLEKGNGDTIHQGELRTGDPVKKEDETAVADSNVHGALLAESGAPMEKEDNVDDCAAALAETTNVDDDFNFDQGALIATETQKEDCGDFDQTAEDFDHGNLAETGASVNMDRSEEEEEDDDDDDFGDFGEAVPLNNKGPATDFDDFGEFADAPADSAQKTEDDDFGDFGDFDEASAAGDDFEDFENTPVAATSNPNDSTEALRHRARAAVSRIFPQHQGDADSYAQEEGGESKNDEVVVTIQSILVRCSSSRFLAHVSFQASFDRGAVAEPPSTRHLLEEAFAGGGPPKSPESFIVAKEARGRYSHYHFPVGGFDSIGASHSASAQQESSYILPDVSRIEIPIGELAKKPQKAKQNLDTVPSKVEPEKTTKQPVPIQNETIAVDNDNEPSQIGKDFVRRIPDLSFMLSTKLVLPKKR